MVFIVNWLRLNVITFTSNEIMFGEFNHTTQLLGGYIGFTLSVRPSVYPTFRVCSVTPTVTWTPDILRLWPLTCNRNKCPCFCTFPLEFGGVGDLHTHQNRRVVCWNHNDLSIKTTVRPRLCIQGKHVFKFHPFKSVWYISHAEHFISN